MSAPYTVEQLDQLILAALQLGFMDDVRHWRKIRAELVAERRNSERSE